MYVNIHGDADDFSGRLRDLIVQREDFLARKAICDPANTVLCKEIDELRCRLDVSHSEIRRLEGEVKTLVSALRVQDGKDGECTYCGMTAPLTSKEWNYHRIIGSENECPNDPLILRVKDLVSKLNRIRAATNV